MTFTKSNCPKVHNLFDVVDKGKAPAPAQDAQGGGARRGGRGGARGGGRGGVQVRGGAHVTGEADGAAQGTATPAAEYVLQFMWVDSISGFAFLGPFFSHKKPFNATELDSIVWAVIGALAKARFLVDGIICDPAPSNISFVKLNAHRDAVEGAPAWSTPNPYARSYKTDKGETRTRFIFFLICLTHVFKNIRNQFYASRRDGTKALHITCGLGDAFGRVDWSFIVDVFNEEMKRVKATPRQHRVVPKLSRNATFLPQPFMKMRVMLARVIFSDEMLLALRALFAGGRRELEGVILFVERVNTLFFPFFFNRHCRVYSLDHPIFAEVERFMSFFSRWRKSVLELVRDGDVEPAVGAKMFLAWQTWDAISISLEGFVGYCEQFFQLYPGHYVCPRRFNQDILEKVFGRLRGMRGASHFMPLSRYATMSGILEFLSGRGVSDRTNTGSMGADVEDEGLSAFHSPRDMVDVRRRGMSRRPGSAAALWSVSVLLCAGDARPQPAAADAREDVRSLRAEGRGTAAKGTRGVLTGACIRGKRRCRRLDEAASESDPTNRLSWAPGLISVGDNSSVAIHSYMLFILCNRSRCEKKIGVFIYPSASSSLSL